jgi:transcriptional regulator with XRE-family HTH domain
MNRLDAYLTARSVSNRDFSQRLGVSEASISRLRRGKQKPSLDVALKIERETAGAVTPTDLVEAVTAHDQQAAE